ncbi:oxygen-dependent tRNA uridine(34) hydroxylase TrhO [Ovoidimarina sediminis]|uniref:oxygen-dependent tRNA uridine(34) hydroxylase TrhO n=1 Tax=Ovoidimarina sediminis TaxID=3079856 RepID=UPI00290B5F33|nr:rhodanese-related sulfurtransferase [Rhodophyticola sp. MJ-SS7]MDU8942472.1 rhodanese-related sulfurtransferase [Rhodophyticola sp. MJ-SS7]
MYVVAALYRFTRVENPAGLKPALLDACVAGGVTGTLILAEEGINGTIAGPEAGIGAVLDHIRGLPGFAALEVKFSTAAEAPFQRMKVRIKREIVTMGQPGVDPLAAVGRYVEPGDWNALISAPDVVTIDTRNDYEVAIGSFTGAVDPETRSFTEFPAWWRKNRDRFEGKRIAMFCTGGIRCEKSTSFLAGEGVEEVFHLKGGILKYLEEVPEEDSLWEGACFVFDRRVSVEHGLAEGPHRLCHGCRRPLLPEDLDRPEYERGVSCHHCIAEHDAADRARFRERQRQIDLRAARATEDGAG